MKKIRYIVISLALMLFLNNSVFAEDIGANTCTNDGSCILLCSYQNNFSGIIGNINIYYNYGKNWSVAYDFGTISSNKVKGPDTFSKIFSKTSSPNIYLGNSLSEENFRCPKYGYFDRNVKVEICFDDDGTTCEDKYSDHTFFSTRFGTWDKDFVAGSEALDYDVYQQIDLYYSRESSILGDITCEDIYNNVYDPNDKDKVEKDIVKDFKDNFLHGKDVPNFLANYIVSDNLVNSYIDTINAKKASCYQENDTQYNEGQVTEEEYEERKEILDNIDPEQFAENVQEANKKLPIEYPEVFLPSGDPSLVLNPENVEGMDLCSQNGVKQVLHILGIVIFIVKLVVPLLLIIMGTIDLVKALKDPDDKSMKDQFSMFIKRILAAIIVFLAPTIINLAFSLIDDANNTNFSGCTECIFKPFGGNCNYTKLGE